MVTTMILGHAERDGEDDASAEATNDDGIAEDDEPHDGDDGTGHSCNDSGKGGGLQLTGLPGLPC